MTLPEPGAGPTPANVAHVRAYIAQHSGYTSTGQPRRGYGDTPIFFPRGQATVAEAIGTSPQNLGRILSGKQVPTFDTWTALLQVIRVAAGVQDEDQAIDTLARARGIAPERLRGLLNLF